MSAGQIAVLGSAMALTSAAVAAFAGKGRQAGWLHPLALPFAVIAVMALGAPLRQRLPIPWCRPLTR